MPEPAVISAARDGDVVAVRRLLDEDPLAADARGQMGETPLHVAVRNGDVELVELLLAAGADPTVRNAGGVSPVHLARIREPEQLRVLLEAAMRASGRSLVEGGERTDSVAFSPDGSLLASACGFQGGAHVRVDRVTADGRLEPGHEIDRADSYTPPERFVDGLPSIVFTPAGNGLVIWETSAIYHDVRPAGWLGDVVMADPASGHVIWERSIDAETTGLRTSLEVAGAPIGAGTAPGVVLGGRAIAVGVDGAVVLLNAADGTTRAVLPIAGTANAVCAEPAPGTLLVATDQGLQRVKVPALGRG